MYIYGSLFIVQKGSKGLNVGNNTNSNQGIEEYFFLLCLFGQPTVYRVDVDSLTSEFSRDFP